MALLKGREMVFKAFESGIFSKLKKLKQSEQSRSDDKHTSSKLNSDLITSSNAPHINFPIDSDISLFTKEEDSKY